jgi:predicted TIM-barrel fold metal-dependent hydrolase
MKFTANSCAGAAQSQPFPISILLLTLSQPRNLNKNQEIEDNGKNICFDFPKDSPMQLSTYRPRPALVVPSTPINAPRFPVIDCHNHLFGDWDTRPAAELISMLDRCGVRGFVDLDGGWGEEILYRHLDKLKSADPQRFRVFGGVDWSQWPVYADGFVEWAAERMREQARRGADGFKVWKMLGTSVRDHTGALVTVDDPRLDLLWRTAGELKLPVTFHVADPVAFFDRLDENNERWEELQANPDWQFPSPPFPPFLEIVNGMANVVARHPATTFIGAHGGCYSENLAWVADLFERCPNFFIDISARLNEFGRQPYSARRFFLKYADRIFFGLDVYADPEAYQYYYRFLETEDEYFPYAPGEIPGQGRWRIYGIYLPEDVLARVYYQNAERILFKR